MEKALVFGAGNIGRGFIGQLFCQSGFAVTFVDVNARLIDLLNCRGQYPVRAVSNEWESEELVRPVSAISSFDEQRVVGEIQDCSLMATAIGTANLEHIAGVLARGLRERIERGGPPVNILVCENMIGANRKLKVLVENHLTEENRRWLDRQVGFVEVSVGRMVPALQAAGTDPLLLMVEPYNHLPYDTSGWRGEPIPLHGGEPHNGFAYYIARKLYLHNLGHAAAAYMGHLYGYEFIDQAVYNPLIQDFVRQAMSESAQALCIEFPNKKEDVYLHLEELLERFQNRALSDPIKRVGGDPLRKLGKEDRLVGAYRKCLAHGIPAPNIIVAIAAATLFQCDGDASAESLRFMMERGLDYTLREHCAITENLLPFHTAYSALNTLVARPVCNASR